MALIEKSHAKLCKKYLSFTYVPNEKIKASGKTKRQCELDANQRYSFHTSTTVQSYSHKRQRFEYFGNVASSTTPESYFKMAEYFDTKSIPFMCCKLITGKCKLYLDVDIQPPSKWHGTKQSLINELISMTNATTQRLFQVQTSIADVAITDASTDAKISLHLIFNRSHYYASNKDILIVINEMKTLNNPSW